MSQKLPNMLDSTLQKIREMVDVNSVIGTPITTPDGVTIIPVSKVSVGFAGGGSDASKKTPAAQDKDNPFGGGVGGGVKVSPVCFLIVKDGNVRMMPVAQPANSSAERLVEMLPDTLEKIDQLLEKKSQKAPKAE